LQYQIAWRQEFFLVAHDLDDAHIVLCLDRRDAQMLSGHAAFQAYTQFRQIVGQAVLRHDLCAATSRQQQGCDQHQISETGAEQHQTQGCRREHLQRRQTRLHCNRRHQQVGRGADQGAHAGELGGIRQRDQQFRG
jgi:hypothetical protein